MNILVDECSKTFKEIDYYNQMIFEINGTDNGDELRHICVICNELTSIDNSISNRGHKLICTKHVYQNFCGDYSKAFKWIEDN